MSELQRLKGLLPPEMQSWVFVEAAAAVEPALITLEEIGRDEVEIQVDLDAWDDLALDHRNLLFWHEVGRVQNDTIPRDGWEMAALAIGLGEIELDGKNLAQVKARELRQQVALVPQRTTVFSGSIAEAIRFGRAASHGQLLEAARLANAHDFIMALPNGYETKLEERGTNVSGGQLQRIAIARAVLGNPAVMLLDEATSALDAEAEAAVQLGLRQAMHGRTVLVIAHRLATVQEADQIVVLDRGQISEQGSHDQLMANNGRYRDLCERQMIRDGRS